MGAGFCLCWVLAGAMIGTARTAGWSWPGHNHNVRVRPTRDRMSKGTLGEHVNVAS